MRAMLGRWWWLIQYRYWGLYYDVKWRLQQGKEYGATLAREAENPRPIPRLVAGEKKPLSRISSADARNNAGTSGAR